MAKKRAKSFNDRMVGRTVLPTIYLWLMAAGAIVAMGIWKPDVVLANLDGFIALLAIISGVAVPALNTVLRMWESEQQIENPPKSPTDSNTSNSKTSFPKRAFENEFSKTRFSKTHICVFI